MKKIALVLVCLVTAAGFSHAQNVTISVDAGRLMNATGTTAVPVGGLLQLIASPSGTFSAPSPSSYATGDNVVVTSFAMNNNGGAAEVFTTFNQLPLSTANYTLTPGEKLTLRFYPSLTLASMPTAPTSGTSYGQVRSDMIEFGTAGGVPSETAWIVPSAGGAVNFEYVTVSNYSASPYSNASAFATGVVVPEPATTGLVGGIIVGLMALAKFRRWIA